MSKKISIAISTNVEDLDKMKEILENCNYKFQNNESDCVTLPTFKLLFGDNEYYVVLLNYEYGLILAPLAEMVAYSNVPNPNNYKYIRHKDGNTLNNNVDNLEWVKELIFD